MKTDSRKKIVHVVEDLKVGGLERVLADIVLGLDKTHYDVQVWCLAAGGLIADDLAERGIPVRILGMKSYYDVREIGRLSCLLRRERFDIVHTHGYFASTFTRLAAVPARVPIILTHVHSTYYDYTFRNLLIERFLAAFTDRIICVSRAVQDFVVETEKISRDKTILIYNGIAAADAFPESPSEKGNLRRSLGFDDEAILVTVVASLMQNKGHALLLQAFQRACRDNQRLRLLIVGDGPLRKQLEADVSRRELDRTVAFAGIRADVQKLLHVSDIFILPSIEREGLGLALIEAMAAGLPVIGTNLGGIPEVVHDGVNGLLVSPGDVTGMADAITKLAHSPEMRRRMGDEGQRMYKEKFTTARMVRQIARLYENLHADDQ